MGYPEWEMDNRGRMRRIDRKGYPVCGVCEHAKHHHIEGGDCQACLHADESGFSSWHAWEQVTLAGGAQTAEQERAAYERAMREE